MAQAEQEARHKKAAEDTAAAAAAPALARSNKVSFYSKFRV
jgi:hypothetical protein